MSQIGPKSTRPPIDFEIDETTIWRDVIARLSEAEVDCIRAELGDERYEWILERPAMQDAAMGVGREPWASIWHVLLWGCLEQGTAVDLLWSSSESRLYEVIDSTRRGLLGPVGDEEIVLVEDCLRGLLAYTDFSRFVTAGLPGESGENRAHQEYEGANVSLIIGLAFCAERPNQSGPPPEESDGLSFISEYDISWRMVVEGVSSPESDCILEAFAENGNNDNLVIDQQVFDGLTEPWEISAWGCLSQENAAHLFEVSDPNWGSSIRNEGMLRISGDNLECAREALLKVDYPKLVATGIPNTDRLDHVPYFALFTALAYCKLGDLEGYENYHYDKIAVIPLSPGVPISGTVDYPEDIDVYGMDVEEGKIYQVSLKGGSLRSPLAGRHDSSFSFSDTYFTKEGTDRTWPITCPSDGKIQKFPMEWRAKRAAEISIIVRTGSCDDLGSYTIKLSVIDN